MLDYLTSVDSIYTRGGGDNCNVRLSPKNQ